MHKESSSPPTYSAEYADAIPPYDYDFLRAPFDLLPTATLILSGLAVEHIFPRAAVEAIIPSPAFDSIVTDISADPIVTASPIDDVITSQSTDDVGSWRAPQNIRPIGLA